MIRKLLLIMIIVILFVYSVAAYDITGEQIDMFQADRIERQLDEETKDMIGDADPYEQMDFAQNVFSVFKKAVSKAFSKLRYSAVTILRVILIIVFCRIADLHIEDRNKLTVSAAGAIAIVAACSGGVNTLIEVARQTLDDISAFSDVLLPVMVSAATASGSLTGAGAAYTLAAFFSSVIIKFCNSVLVPVVYAYLALATADSVLQQKQLKPIRELLGWITEKGLRCVVYIYTGLLTITGLLTSGVDSAALKATKLTISGAVPVVGSIISNASETVLSSAAVLKNTIGAFGMLAVLAIFLVPFLEIGISYVMFKMGTAIGGMLDSKHSELIASISTVMGYLLAMTATGALISLLTCCGFLRMVSV